MDALKSTFKGITNPEEWVRSGPESDVSSDQLLQKGEFSVSPRPTPKNPANKPDNTSNRLDSLKDEIIVLQSSHQRILPRIQLAPAKTPPKSGSTIQLTKSHGDEPHTTGPERDVSPSGRRSFDGARPVLTRTDKGYFSVHASADDMEVKLTPATASGRKSSSGSPGEPAEKPASSSTAPPRAEDLTVRPRSQSTGGSGDTDQQPGSRQRSPARLGALKDWIPTVPKRSSGEKTPPSEKEKGGGMTTANPTAEKEKKGGSLIIAKPAAAAAAAAEKEKGGSMIATKPAAAEKEKGVLPGKEGGSSISVEMMMAAAQAHQVTRVDRSGFEIYDEMPPPPPQKDSTASTLPSSPPKPLMDPIPPKKDSLPALCSNYAVSSASPPNSLPVPPTRESVGSPSTSPRNLVPPAAAAASEIKGAALRITPHERYAPPPGALEDLHERSGTVYSTLPKSPLLVTEAEKFKNLAQRGSSPRAPEPATSANSTTSRLEQLAAVLGDDPYKTVFTPLPPLNPNRAPSGPTSPTALSQQQALSAASGGGGGGSDSTKLNLHRSPNAMAPSSGPSSPSHLSRTEALAAAAGGDLSKTLFTPLPPLKHDPSPTSTAPPSGPTSPSARLQTLGAMQPLKREPSPNRGSLTSLEGITGDDLKKTIYTPLHREGGTLGRLEVAAAAPSADLSKTVYTPLAPLHRDGGPSGESLGRLEALAAAAGGDASKTVFSPLPPLKSPGRTAAPAPPNSLTRLQALAAASGGDASKTVFSSLPPLKRDPSPNPTRVSGDGTLRAGTDYVRAQPKSPGRSPSPFQLGREREETKPNNT